MKKETVTHNVKVLRESKNLTQSQFAEKASISESTVSQVEQGAKKLSADTAIAIRNAFNVSLDWLFGLAPDTNDAASNILADMRKHFCVSTIGPEACQYKVAPDTLTVAIDDNLMKFLLALFDAEKTCDDKNLDDDVRHLWIDGKKREYNERAKLEEHSSKTVYMLIPPEEYDARVKDELVKSRMTAPPRG